MAHELLVAPTNFVLTLLFAKRATIRFASPEFSVKGEVLPHSIDIAQRLEGCADELEASAAAIAGLLDCAQIALRDILGWPAQAEQPRSESEKLPGECAGGIASAARLDSLQSVTERFALTRSSEGQFFVGRRTLSVTEAEDVIMQLLWKGRPEAVPRASLHAALISRGSTAKAGAIDVYIHNLRGKLQLASSGRLSIQMKRGIGWSLSGECL